MRFPARLLGGLTLVVSFASVPAAAGSWFGSDGWYYWFPNGENSPGFRTPLGPDGRPIPGPGQPIGPASPAPRNSFCRTVGEAVSQVRSMCSHTPLPSPELLDGVADMFESIGIRPPGPTMPRLCEMMSPDFDFEAWRDFQEGERTGWYGSGEGGDWSPDWSGGPGSSWGPACTSGLAAGDPHLTTLDGLAYDYQGAGEFWLYRSAQKGLDVAARFVPAGSQVSIVQAAAMTVTDEAGNRHRISIFPGTEQPIWVDDVAVAPSGGAGETRVWLTLPAKHLATYDGYTVTLLGPKAAVSVGGASVSVDVYWTPGANDARGLLGNHDGDPANDLVDAFGVPATLGTETLGKSLATWRIDASESPFHYFAGESWATFQDFDFPRGPATPPTAEAQALGDHACAGVENDVHRANCAYDFALTGDFAVVDGAQAAPEPTVVLMNDESGQQQLVDAAYAAQIAAEEEAQRRLEEQRQAELQQQQWEEEQRQQQLLDEQMRAEEQRQAELQQQQWEEEQRQQQLLDEQMRAEEQRQAELQQQQWEQEQATTDM